MKERLKAYFTTTTGALCLVVTFVSIFRGSMDWNSGVIGIFLGIVLILTPKKVEQSAARGLKDFFKGKGLQILALSLLLSSCSTTNKNLSVENKQVKTDSTATEIKAFTDTSKKETYSFTVSNDSTEELTETKTIEQFNDSGKIKARITETRSRKKSASKKTDQKKETDQKNILSNDQKTVTKKETLTTSKKQVHKKTCSFLSFWWVALALLLFIYLKIKK